MNFPIEALSNRHLLPDLIRYVSGQRDGNVFVQIIRELNPLSVNRQSASVPPTIAASSSPCLIILAPSMMALAADEQAVLMVVIKSLIPKYEAINSVLAPQSCEITSRNRPCPGFS